MRHPVPPQVARRILRPHDDWFSLPGLDTITLAELGIAIESFMMACDTAQMYADVILRHTTRLCTADTIVGNMSDLILDFHIFVGGPFHPDLIASAPDATLSALACQVKLPLSI